MFEMIPLIRASLVLLFLVPLQFGAENSNLPSDAQQVLTAYDADYAKLKADFDELVIKRAAKAKASLLKAQEAATKKGKLDEALAIKGSIEKLDGSLPVGSTDLLGRKVKVKAAPINLDGTYSFLIGASHSGKLVLRKTQATEVLTNIQGELVRNENGAIIRWANGTSWNILTDEDGSLTVQASDGEGKLIKE